MATDVHLAALSAVGGGYPVGIPVIAEEAPPAPPAPPLVAPPVPVAPPLPMVPPVRAVVPPEPPLLPVPPVEVFPPTAEVPPVPETPPVPDCPQVDMHRAHMSDGTSRSVAQHAHAQTAFVHWPSTGIGTLSSVEQVHLSPPSLASHWAIALYCVLHVAMALTVASAPFTQLIWHSVTGQTFVICVCDAHIAVQACARVNAVPESREVLPPALTPPKPASVPPVAFPVKPPEPAPPVSDGLPPLPDMPPSVPPVAFPVEPPEPAPPVPDDVPPPPDVPPRVVAPPLELASLGSALLLLLEQADMNIIAAGSARKIEPVLCVGKLLAMQG